MSVAPCERTHVIIALYYSIQCFSPVFGITFNNPGIIPQPTRMGDARQLDPKYPKRGWWRYFMGLRFLIVFWGFVAFLGLAGASYIVVSEARSSTDRIATLADLETGEVIQADPDPQSRSAGWAVAVCDGAGSILNFVVLHETVVRTLLFVQPGEAASIPKGELLEGPDRGPHNAPRHLGPPAATIAKSTVGTCDGNLEFNGKDLQHY
jgi:hypothetical protein